MRYSFLFLFLFLFLAYSNLLGQKKNIEFTKENFSNLPELEEALDNIKKGDLCGKTGQLKNLTSLDYYLLAYKFNSENSKLNSKIGLYYLNKGDKKNSLFYLKKAYELDNNISSDIHYILGKVYQLNMNFDMAIREYNLFNNSLLSEEFKRLPDFVVKRLKECENGKILMKTPINVLIENIGKIVNSKYPDYSPVITADESLLYFTSRKENSTGGVKDQNDNQYFEDIYVTTKNEKDEYLTPVNIGKPLNTNGHDATVGLSFDGQQMFVYNGDANGDIYLCDLKGDKWSSPELLPETINTDMHESSACMNFDGNIIYFVSDRLDDNMGGRDIFMSKKNKKGKWSQATNLGPIINTEYDEDGVYMHPDGKTLYFSSKGHNSMGGYDVFKSIIQSTGEWSKPINLGFPINTSDDDVYFVMSANGKHGYYSSAKDGGFGEKDIYRITFIENKVENIKESVHVTLLKGIVADATSKKPIEASIEIIDNEKNEVITTFNSNSSSGRYLIALPSGKNYGISVNAAGYLFYSENINFADTSQFQEIIINVNLGKISLGSKIILKNIFFDYAKATLNTESISELERLKKLLIENPNLKIEISGHTDIQGTQKINLVLSEERAKAVVDYLMINGISPKRLQYKGYGSSVPVDNNSTEIGRQNNRRVEFKIISNSF